MRSVSVYGKGLLAGAVGAAALLSAAPTAMQSTDAVSAVQKVIVNATGGTFTLTFEGQTTKPIAFDASAAGPHSVESELDALSSIGGIGGSVSVTGGPGDSTGSSPYLVTAGGTLRGVPETVSLFAIKATMTADGSSLSGGEHVVTITLLNRTGLTAGSTKDEYDVQVENIGGSASSGKITLTDKLPPGVTVAVS